MTPKEIKRQAQLRVIADAAPDMILLNGKVLLGDREVEGADYVVMAGVVYGAETNPDGEAPFTTGIYDVVLIPRTSTIEVECTVEDFFENKEAVDYRALINPQLGFG